MCSSSPAGPGRHAAGLDDAIEELARAGRATTIGLAFDEQVVDELPREAHDAPVALIVTPTETIVSGAP